MEIESLRHAIEQAGMAAAIAGFLTGLIFSFNPVAVAAIPVTLAYVTKAREKRTAFVYGAMFILGLILTHVALGLIAGFGGLWVEGLIGRFWGALLGPVLIILGLIWTGWLRIPLPKLSFRAQKVTGIWGAFTLGIPFSVAVCPFCTPALIVILGVVATIGSPVFGALVMLAFAVGRAIPIALGAVAISSVKHLKVFSRYQQLFNVIGGVLLIASGLYLLNAYYFLIPALAI
ncbi:MAG: cytochrome C biogenesis protein [Methylophilales bacterium 28-44-11]|nr:MAG: cytochrome C biogenesis protein [Methylophilales bacterium 28-44-11]